MSNVQESKFEDWVVSPRYRLERIIGSGSYGVVAKAYDEINKYPVAIKRIHVTPDQRSMARMYREIHILKSVRHDRIVKLLDVLEPPCKDTFNEIYLVFELMDLDLGYVLTYTTERLNIDQVQAIMFDILSGVQHLHKRGIIHRDLKPGNILVLRDCSAKVCDLGLARVLPRVRSVAMPIPVREATRQMSSGEQEELLPRDPRLSRHVATRWYRAPELILLMRYGCAVDIWAVGCIFAELLASMESLGQHVLFPGGSCFPLSTETDKPLRNDQFRHILDVLGPLSEGDTAHVDRLCHHWYIQAWGVKGGISFEDRFPRAPPEAIDLLKQMLQFNDQLRITASDALEHPFFAGRRVYSDDSMEENLRDFDLRQMSTDYIRRLIYKEIMSLREINNQTI